MLEQLKARYPWPARRPDAEPDLGPAWFLDDDKIGHSAVLKRLIHPEVRVVLELGSFCGRSTRCFMRLCPNAHVVAIDTWKGSPDMQVNPEFTAILPRLYDTFLVNLWDHRDRLIPVRATTIRGMEEVHSLGIPVDAIYVDADHSTPAVIEDITCALRLFPDAQIIGDDWLWPSVRAAVTSVARQWGERICVEGTVWWFPRPATPRRGRPAPRAARSAAGKAIAIMLYRRPEYLRQVLEALARCAGIDDYQVVMHVEPGCPEVFQLAQDIPLRRKTIVENTSILGATSNACSAIEHAFRFSDYVIVLDDDIVPAADCLRYFEWAGEKYRDDREVFTVSAYARETPPPARYHSVRRLRWFTPWGWATWRDRWEEMRAHWGFGEPFSWDVIVNRTRGERFEIQPFLSRVQNIGAEGGVHVPDPQWHREHQYNEFGAWSVSLDPAGRFVEEPVNDGAADTASLSRAASSANAAVRRHGAPRLHYCTFAGADNRYPYLERTYETCVDYFDAMHIADLGASDETSRLNARDLHDSRVHYRRLPDETISTWSKTLSSAIDDVPVGDWFLLMDSDERPSPMLLEAIRDLVGRSDRDGVNCVHVTGLLHYNGVLDAEGWRTPEEWFESRPKTLDEFQRRPVWTKPMLIKRLPGLTAQSTGPHGHYRQPGMKPGYTPLWYNHYKTESQMAQSYAVFSWPLTHLVTFSVPIDSPEYARHAEIVTRSGLTTVASLLEAIRSNAVPEFVMDYWASLRDSRFVALQMAYRHAHEFHFQVHLTETCRLSCCAYGTGPASSGREPSRQANGRPAALSPGGVE